MADDFIETTKTSFTRASRCLVAFRNAESLCTILDDYLIATKHPERKVVLDRSHEVIVNKISRTLTTLFALLLSISPNSAEGRVLAPTSRATVSISITVSPHIVVDRPDQSHSVSAHTGILCIRTTGLSSFHVELIPTDAASSAFDLRPGDLANRQRWCQQDITLGAAVRFDASAGSEGSHILLIVPD